MNTLYIALIIFILGFEQSNDIRWGFRVSRIFIIKDNPASYFALLLS